MPKRSRPLETLWRLSLSAILVACGNQGNGPTPPPDMTGLGIVTMRMRFAGESDWTTRRDTVESARQDGVLSFSSREANYAPTANMYHLSFPLPATAGVFTWNNTRLYSSSGAGYSLAHISFGGFNHSIAIDDWTLIGTALSVTTDAIVAGRYVGTVRGRARRAGCLLPCEYVDFEGTFDLHPIAGSQ